MRFPAFRLVLGSLIAAGALVVAGPMLSVSAHDALDSSAPAADSSITADPGAVTLGFSEDLISLGSSTDGFAIQVVDPEGLHHESGCVSIAGAQVSAPIALGDAGGYVVLWQVVSSDGHPTSGQYQFDYEPTSLDGAADGLTDAPVCGEAWAGAPDGASPTPAASPSATSTAPAPLPTATADASGGADSPVAATQTAVPVTDNASSLPWPIVVLIVVAGLGALAAIVLLVIRRGRSGGFKQG
ncbi:copper resistance protein CopC [Herbiconiux sp.]|uniref:copper resistance CopC family protein n=1 Tax=Herbiconiux sp. TaxID=1871186 RepID=UPI0025BFFDDB|nr:copper resistance protein CopC [Herbiconiux sp.]